jgi:hypothetical protein
LEWNLRDCSHRFILARFEPVAGAVPPLPTTSAPAVAPQPRLDEPNGTLVDKAELPSLAAGELPRSPDETLTELRNVLLVAQQQHATDPQFIRVLDKVLAKFYYLFEQRGELQVRPPKPATVEGQQVEAAKAQGGSSSQSAGTPEPNPAARGSASSTEEAPRFRGIW